MSAVECRVCIQLGQIYAKVFDSSCRQVLYHSFLSLRSATRTLPSMIASQFASDAHQKVVVTSRVSSVQTGRRRPMPRPGCLTSGTTESQLHPRQADAMQPLRRGTLSAARTARHASRQQPRRWAHDAHGTTGQAPPRPAEESLGVRYHAAIADCGSYVEATTDTLYRLVALNGHRADLCPLS